MKIISVFVLATILIFPVFTAGQEVENQPIAAPDAPENVLREVVRRILVYKFKPSNRPKIVRLAGKNINQSWLPEIRNVEFRLLSEDKVLDSETGIYFFTKPEFSKEIYDVNFAFGDPECGYGGEGWRFRIVGNNVRLWLVGGIGGGCGGGGEFTIPGKLNTYPNELKDYKFFDKDRLKGLRLTISNGEDVKNAFGEECEFNCDFDAGWEIQFSYFGGITIERTVDDKTTNYVPDAPYLGKLSSITLIPKSTILFDKVKFSSKFLRSYGSSAAHDGKGGGTNKSYISYADRYGLEYSVLDSVITTKKDLVWQKGELMNIEYKLPKKIEEKIYVEQK